MIKSMSWEPIHYPKTVGWCVQTVSAPEDFSEIICVLGGKYESQATAQLLASAPDLLEALLAAREHMIGSSPAIKALIEKTYSAIAKAKGAK